MPIILFFNLQLYETILFVYFKTVWHLNNLGTFKVSIGQDKPNHLDLDKTKRELFCPRQLIVIKGMALFWISHKRVWRKWTPIHHTNLMHYPHAYASSRFGKRSFRLLLSKICDGSLTSDLHEYALRQLLLVTRNNIHYLK